MRVVSNEEFNKAWTIENRKIMSRAGRTFRKVIPDDEFKTCQLISLWKALGNYNGSVKFTSYLYHIMSNECRKYVKKDKKYKTLPTLKKKNYDIDFNSLESDIYTILPQDLAELIHLRYYNSCTLNELSKKFNLTEFKIKKKLNKAISLLKETLK